ncbi:hypothetical protein D3C78_1419240 [compost metagenome]
MVGVILVILVVVALAVPLKVLCIIKMLVLVRLLQSLAPPLISTPPFPARLPLAASGLALVRFAVTAAPTRHPLITLVVVTLLPVFALVAIRALVLHALWALSRALMLVVPMSPHLMNPRRPSRLAPRMKAPRFVFPMTIPAAAP